MKSTIKCAKHMRSGRERWMARCRPPGWCWIFSTSSCTSCGRRFESITTWKGSGATRRASERESRPGARGYSNEVSTEPIVQERGGLLALGGELRGSFYHFVQEFLEFSQPWRGNDDGIAPPIHVLGNAQKAAARVFFQREDKRFAFDLNLVGLQGILLHCRPGTRRVGPRAIR